MYIQSIIFSFIELSCWIGRVGGDIRNNAHCQITYPDVYRAAATSIPIPLAHDIRKQNARMLVRSFQET